MLIAVMNPSEPEEKSYRPDRSIYDRMFMGIIWTLLIGFGLFVGCVIALLCAFQFGWISC